MSETNKISKTYEFLMINKPKWIFKDQLSICISKIWLTIHDCQIPSAQAQNHIKSQQKKKVSFSAQEMS